MGNGKHGRRRTIKKKMFLIPFPAASQVCPNSQTIPVLSARKAAEACTGQGKNKSPLNPPEGDIVSFTGRNTAVLNAEGALHLKP